MKKFDEILLNTLMAGATLALILLIIFIGYIIGAVIGWWPLSEVLKK